MRPLLLAVVIAGVGMAGIPDVVEGNGRVAIYSDESLSDCTLSDASSRIANIYIAETSLDGIGLRFRVAASPGFTGVWLNENTPHAFVGNSQTDLSIGFANCMVGHFLVLTMTYQLFGTSNCSTLSIAAAPGFLEPICAGCHFTEEPCWGYGPLHVNCSGPFDCNPVAAESSTWGRVKALYRD